MKEPENVFLTHGWECGFESSGHMVFQGSVVLVAFRHCLTCPTHPPCMVFGFLEVSTSALVKLFSYLGSISYRPFIHSFLCCDAIDLWC